MEVGHQLVQMGWHPARMSVVVKWAEIRMFRWMCDFRVKDLVHFQEELKERLLDDITLVLQQNRLLIGMCCEKKTMIGWRNVWSMKWRMPDK